MPITKQQKPSIQDSEIFKAIDAKGTCVIDVRPPYEKLHIPDEAKFDKETLFWNPFTELHPEDWEGIITAEMGGMYREKANSTG